ncbi:hypothetical protein CsSME_00027080 [Camellia sinensis var. sinensis]
MEGLLKLGNTMTFSIRGLILWNSWVHIRMFYQH